MKAGELPPAFALARSPLVSFAPEGFLPGELVMP